ncbi:unnamed protein product [Rhizoctonia solani]|uniref:DUF6606 domain-containing protein n=1 Tax=Rhizoctonia solani TaxID=456999 RepID=A0A8H3DJL8_9AGAM|nr:unnamed protein product [Rhizoctonia solani]
MTTHIGSAVLEHLAYNVFLPPKLPQEEQEEPFQRSVDLAIVDSVIQSGQEFSAQSGVNSQWSRVDLMLKQLHRYVEVPIEKAQLYEDIKNMKPEAIVALHIRAQNTGLIIRRQADQMSFEAFEVQPQTADVMSVPGKIIRHFPGPAVQVPFSVANDDDFLKEVANILTRMDTDVLDEAHPKTRKAGMDVRESRNSINPNYFIQYFFGFLRGMGAILDPPRIIKRLADETSLDSTITYKHFMAYNLATTLSQCIKRDSFSSDLLYAMRVKMARRLYKVRDTAPQFLIDAAMVAAEGTQSLLQERWDMVQAAQAQSLNQRFPISDFEPAINQKLPYSRNYLEQVFQGRSGQATSLTFNREHSPRLENIATFSQYADGALSQSFKNDPHLALFDFEASVFDHLASWTSECTQENYSRACAIMSSCFRQYLAAAKSYYTADIADQSIMMLTLTRMWMAIDELATKDCPLLREYSPELPVDLLDPLLLRTAQHIEQARIIQQHICMRRAGALVNNPSIFSDGATDACFAVQFFRNSSRHQEIKLEIERDAQMRKNKKIQELAEQNSQYKRLSKEIQVMSHEYSYTDGWQRHSRYCTLCDKENEQGRLEIRPYEWPLPSAELCAKVVVFELERPASFTIWRDITYEILVDLGTRSPRDECTQYTTLKAYDPLDPWVSTPFTTPRITIASATKSFMRSHYSGTISIPTDESQVCMDNALQFRLYDKKGEAWATGPFPDVTFAKFGSLKLPPNSLYRHLEYALESTTHTSNQVLADQHNCPEGLTLHEWIAFGTLRSGARLQWMNIIRGLEEDLLTFSSDEVCLLHTQAAWQIGPLSNDGSREWHEEIGKLASSELHFDYW